MNKFFNYLQPTIIQATMDEELPERVRGRFFVNFNVFGIPYFTENYFLLETSFGAPYLILKEDNWGLQLEDTTEGELLDIPRIYIDITDQFLEDKDNIFESFVAQALMDNKIWVRGIDKFFAGMEYYTNYTLYNYFALHDMIETPDFGSRLPNYLDKYGFIQTKYWKDLSGEIYKDYNNLEYFKEKNDITDNTFPEEYLDNFYSSMMDIILKYTKITEEKKAEGNNPIYNLVLNYFKDFQTDCGSTALSLILNSGYTFQETTTTTKCGCNSDSASTTITQSCYDLYKQAMYNWLIQMFSDKEFYKDWFRIYKTEDEYIPNDILIEELNKFFEEFLKLQRSLTFLNEKYRRCDCPSPVTFNTDECNNQILRNFLQILNWVFDDELDENTNKIKIYGKQFGELLPKLIF